MSRAGGYMSQQMQQKGPKEQGGSTRGLGGGQRLAATPSFLDVVKKAQAEVGAPADQTGKRQPSDFRRSISLGTLAVRVNKQRKRDEADAVELHPVQKGVVKAYNAAGAIAGKVKKQLSRTNSDASVVVRKHRLSDLIQQKRTKIEAEQRDRARTARSGWRHLRRNVKRIAKTHEEGRAMNRFGLRPPARPPERSLVH